MVIETSGSARALAIICRVPALKSPSSGVNASLNTRSHPTKLAGELVPCGLRLNNGAHERTSRGNAGFSESKKNNTEEYKQCRQKSRDAGESEGQDSL